MHNFTLDLTREFTTDPEILRLILRVDNRSREFSIYEQYQFKNRGKVLHSLIPFLGIATCREAAKFTNTTNVDMSHAAEASEELTNI